eukprot:TRINITY_DN17221_c0_g1_i1.p1 TRINITY_DN17221_c0_g1~~TRINITY_DN17221_c0_g1_i1.p1  ORF type:complete len:1052 (+),score=187.57 TRINITY_DN17221_c0_g1_i1:647-3802(+)
MDQRRRQPLSALLLYALGCCCLVFLRTSLAHITDIEPIYIDCGNPVGVVEAATGITWLADDDSFTTAGTFHRIGTPFLGDPPLSDVDATLRSWTDGDSCYQIPVSNETGRYLIRLSFAYNNYDNTYLAGLSTNELPNVGVSIEENFVEAIYFPDKIAPAYYTDYVATVADGNASLCFIPLPSSADASGLSPSFVNSIQVIPVVSNLFGASRSGVLMSNWIRINAGATEPLLPPPDNTDYGYRTWSADIAATGDNWIQSKADANFTIPQEYAEFSVQPELFMVAREAGDLSTGYNVTKILPVEPDDEFLVILYFAEVDEGIQAKERVFNIWVNNHTLYDIDLAQRRETYGSSVYIVNFTVPLIYVTQDGTGISGNVLVLLYASEGSSSPPILSGLEIYGLIAPVTTTGSTPGGDLVLRIDCGSSTNYTDAFGNVWVGDSPEFVTSGDVSVVLNTNNTLEMANTVRFFNVSVSSALNCYSVPVAPGRYIVRGFFDYGDWDKAPKRDSATYGIAVEGVSLVRIHPEDGAPGFFESVIAHVNDGYADFCLLAEEANRATYINALEIIQIDSYYYNIPQLDESEYVFYTYYRVTSGDTFGDGISSVTDVGHRQWFSDLEIITFGCSNGCNVTPTTQNIAASNVTPNYWPQTLYQSARVATDGEGGDLLYSLENMVPGKDLLVYFHFAEIDASVEFPGQRVFNIFLNHTLLNLTSADGASHYTDIDILKIAGGNFRAVDLYCVLQVPEGETKDGTLLELNFKPTSSGQHYGPMLSGLEVLGAFPNAVLTYPSHANAMRSLASSMEVGQRAGWQGDPCMPRVWTGVTCDIGSEGKNRISSISLSGYRLPGVISDDISALDTLTSLNLSSCNLTGRIPDSIADLSSIVTIDLSHNKLSGPLPSDLSALQSLHTLFLNDNLLSGQIPGDLNPPPSSVNANFSGNAGLCGGAGYQDCSNIPPPPSPPLPPLAPPSETSGSGGGNLGVIIGCTIAGVVLLLLLLLLGAILLRRRKQKMDDEMNRTLQKSTSYRRNPYWRSQGAGEFEMMNPAGVVTQRDDDV